MKTKRFFFSLTLILGLVLGGIFVSIGANESVYEVEKSYYENNLRNYFGIKKWEKYEKTIQAFSEKNKDNNEKIIKKLEKIKKSLNAKSTKTQKEFIQLSLVSYIISSLESVRYNEEIKQVSTITEEEKEAVERKIILLQNILIEKIKKGLDIEKGSDKGIEQTGKVYAKASTPLLGSPFSTKIQLNNLTTKTKNLDSQISTNIDFSLDFNNKKTEFNSFIELINKENKSYLLLENLEILAEENEDFAPFLNLLKEINEKTGHLQLDTNNNFTGMQNFHVEKNLESYKKILALENESLFKVSKKEGGKYSLLPKKDACDIIMESLGKNCNDSDYKNILKLFLTHKASLYLSEENGNYSLEFLSMIDNDMIQKARISYNTSDILSIDYDIIPNQNKFPGEKLELSYKKNKTLKVLLIADMKKEKMAYANIDFSLNNKNQIETGGWKINIENFSSEGEIKNNEISGNFNRKDTYNNRGINGTIKGNIEENIAVDFSSKGYQGKLIGDIDFSKKDFSLLVNYSGEQGNNFNVSFIGKSEEKGEIEFIYDMQGMTLFFFNLNYEMNTKIKSLDIKKPSNTFTQEELNSYKSLNY